MKKVLDSKEEGIQNLILTWINPIDREIVTMCKMGKTTSEDIAKKINRSRQYVCARVQMLYTASVLTNDDVRNFQRISKNDYEAFKALFWTVCENNDRRTFNKIQWRVNGIGKLLVDLYYNAQNVSGRRRDA